MYIYIYISISISIYLSLSLSIYLSRSLSLSIYIYIYIRAGGREGLPNVLPAAARCDMVLHQAFRTRHVRTNNIGDEVRHGVTSGVSCETSLNKHITPHLHREYNC